jgi:hypothetical protein
VDIAELSRFVKCDTAAGAFTWLVRAPDMVPSRTTRSAAAWNKRFSGKSVKLQDHGRGYLKFKVCGSYVSAHRAVWAFHYGQWPQHQIDHIDGDRSNNRIANLRDVIGAENCKNKKTYRTSRSGVAGVFWSAKGKCWCARIFVCGRLLWLGSFATMEDAVGARKIAECINGFHTNHGRA